MKGPAETDEDPRWLHLLGGLRGFVRRRVPAQDAEDVTQEVLLRIHRGAFSLRDSERLEGWVFTVARRAVADYFRRRRPAQEEASPIDALPDPDAELAGAFASFEGDHSVHEEVLSWLRPLAEQLPEAYGRALILADFEGWPQGRVAETLGLSLPGAKSRIQRARRMLAEELQRCCRVEIGAEGKAVDFERRHCDC